MLASHDDLLARPDTTEVVGGLLPDVALESS
jgi:hypothetical protein